MSNPVYIVGLDIGTTKIACFVGEKVENGKIIIRGYGKTESTGVKRGMVFNIEETVNAIKRAVEQGFRTVECRYQDGERGYRRSSHQEHTASWRADARQS